MNPANDRRRGLLLGLALGDALGARFEGGPLMRGLWALVGLASPGVLRWTDDTSMALDIAESIGARGVLDQDDLAERFAGSYRWSRGYGPGAARTLRAIRGGMPWREARFVRFPDGSFGNGAAMRAPAVALGPWPDGEALLLAAARSAEVTHAHGEAIESARLVALAAWRLLGGERAQVVEAEVLELARAGPLGEALRTARDRVHRGRLGRRALPNGMRAAASAPTAIALGLARVDGSFEDLFAEVRTLGGDVDTIGAMAGALWGSARGADELPASPLERLEQVERIVAATRASCGVGS